MNNILNDIEKVETDACGLGWGCFIQKNDLIFF